jgi:hypothetical protein
MGREVVCVARFDGQSRSGKALLETAEIIFRSKTRGQPPVRIPFAGIKKLSATGGTLTVRWTGGEAAFALGKDAAAWAQKIKNPPSRIDKLGVKPGMKVAVVGTIEPAVQAEIAGRAVLRAGKPRGGQDLADLVFLAVDSKADLNKLPALAKVIAPAGAIWVVRRKGKQAPVSEAESMAAGKAAGLVDTKVVAFSDTHTAERYVIPVSRRGQQISG